MSERTLVTGFGPFLSVSDNPSSRLAEALEHPFQILDVSYDAVEDFIFHLDPSSFDRLLMLGVATGRAHLSAELFARNTYGQAPDVSGALRTGAIQQGQPLLLGSTLFGDEDLANLMVSHPKLRISLDAGCYLCNFSYFKALTTFPHKQIGFIHVPPIDKISFEEQLQAIQDVLFELEHGSSRSNRAA